VIRVQSAEFKVTSLSEATTMRSLLRSPEFRLKLKE